MNKTSRTAVRTAPKKTATSSKAAKNAAAKKLPAVKSTSVAAPEVDDRVIVENINVPGYTMRVDRTMYDAMRIALLKVLPLKSPGLTQSEMRQGVLPHLPTAYFPGGAKAGWWAKCVQLDLEAKGLVVRENTKPLRWLRTKK